MDKLCCISPCPNLNRTLFLEKLLKSACGALRVKLWGDKVMLHPACHEMIKMQIVVKPLWALRKVNTFTLRLVSYFNNI